MWQVVFITTEQEEAIELQEQIQKEGFLIKIDVLQDEENGETYQLLVPLSEAEEALNLISEL